MNDQIAAYRRGAAGNWCCLVMQTLGCCQKYIDPDRFDPQWSEIGSNSRQ